jgi:PAS domain S-box-containing protein
MEYEDKSKENLMMEFNELRQKYNSLKTRLNIDKSDNKLIEPALKTCEYNYQSIFNIVTESIFIQDINSGKIVDVNDAMLMTYGYSTKDEVLKCKVGDLSANIKPYDDEAAQIKIYKAINEGPQTFDWIARKKDGSSFWIEIKLIKTEIGKEDVILAVGRDITERKHMEYELQRNEKRLLAAQSCAHIGSWEHDLAVPIDFWSDEMFRIFGCDPALGTPTFLDFLEMVHPQDRERVGRNLFQAIDEKKIFGEEYRIVRFDGSLRWLAGRGEPLFDQNGNMIQYVGTVQDITDRKIAEISLLEKSNEIEAQNEEYKQLNEELYKAKEKAEESDRLKTAFLQNMSHEIRTPMNAVMGFSELIKDNLDNKPKLIEFARIINQRSSDLLDIINDILDISKIESGQLTVNMEECNLHGLFAELTSFFTEYQTRIGKKHINLSLQALCVYPESTIITDKVKLKQIFINLINNAFKFTEVGKIEGGCRMDVNKNLLFYVSDTGIGIPPDKQQIIFERFSQLNPGANKLVSGTGLGLPIVKGLVSLLGGNIHLQSEPNKGSTFSFSFPYKPFEHQQLTPVFVDDASDKNWSNKTILIVEDDFFNMEYLKEIVSGKGLNLLFAMCGKEGVEIALNKSIDIVLMDIRLPDINGYEAIRQIRIHKPNLKIIAQTAFASHDQKQKAFDAGCNDYISKPTKRDMLVSMLKKHLFTL